MTDRSNVEARLDACKAALRKSIDAVEGLPIAEMLSDNWGSEAGRKFALARYGFRNALELLEKTVVEDNGWCKAEWEVP